MNKQILKISNLSYKYSDAKDNEFVLKNINYSFKAGKVYAIKGKSGSSKTTLLSLISELESNYQGSIKFLDKELKDIDLDYYRSKDIGIVFQSYNLLPHLTASENIILFMNISNLKIENKEEKALSLMEQVKRQKSIKIVWWRTTTSSNSQKPIL